MQFQDTVITQEAHRINHPADLEEFAQQHADTSIDEGTVRLNNREDEGKVFSIGLRPHTDFFVEPSQSDQIARPQQDNTSNPDKAAVQLEQPRSATLNQQQSGVVSRFDAGCLMVGHWECQICGARCIGSLPATCEACGADHQYLEHPKVIRLEMTTR